MFWALVCFAKQRLAHGMVGLRPHPDRHLRRRAARQADLALGAPFLRQAQPAKQARAEQRFPPGRRTEVIKNRVLDAIGGVPEDEYKAKLAPAPRKDRP